MRNQIVFNYDNKNAGEFYCPPVQWDESEVNVLTVDKPSAAERELEQLYLEALEYDFLMGKTPEVIPENWQVED